MVADTTSDSPPENKASVAVDTPKIMGEVSGAMTPSWSDQDETLRALWKDNKSPEEISVALGRSVAAIMTRAARLGLPRRAAPGRKRGYKRVDRPYKTLPAAGTRVRVTLPPQTGEEEVYRAPEIKTRICLMCLTKFQSQGPHNRICPSCKGSAEYATGSSTPDFAFKVIS